MQKLACCPENEGKEISGNELPEFLIEWKARLNLFPPEITMNNSSNK